jgi:hypothetical protein
VVHGFLRSGDKGARTPDLLDAIETLSQLSYIPVGSATLSNPSARVKVVRVRGGWRIGRCGGLGDGGFGEESEADVEAVREVGGDLRDEGALHVVFGDDGLIAGDDEADALAGVEVGGGGELDVESGVGAFADDADVVAVGEEVEEFDRVVGLG